VSAGGPRESIKRSEGRKKREILVVGESRADQEHDEQRIAIVRGDHGLSDDIHWQVLPTFNFLQTASSVQRKGTCRDSVRHERGWERGARGGGL